MTERSPSSAPRSVGSRLAFFVVFATSFAVLTLEILAGRLMAPYLGVSLETFTGVIGTVLAGIAVGAWGGGRLADEHSAVGLIGPAITIGGALTIVSVPVVDSFGPVVGQGPPAIVLLTAAAFLAPSTVLSAISPMVAKLQLDDLADTGSVVGKLSAAGTVGALAGTYLTGFVLVAALPTRTTVVILGALCVVGGLAWIFLVSKSGLSWPLALLVVFGGFSAQPGNGPCETTETAYFCVAVRGDEDRPGLRSLYLDRLRHAAVDLDDPTFLDLRYVRLFADVTATLPDGPVRGLHLGGGGFTFPRYLTAQRPGSEHLVLEIDEELVGIVEDELGLELGPDLRVRTGDARLALADLPDDGFDVIIGDAFGSMSVPWHLTTSEFVAELDRVLTDDGVYVMNVIDGGDSAFARAELATLAIHFDHVALIEPADGVPPDRAVNQILVASDRPLTEPSIDPADGRWVDPVATAERIGDAEILLDDHAPVDQLLR